MISCQRCGQPLTPNTPTCPRCGAPVTPSAGWSQPQPGAMGASPFGAGPFSPYGGPPSPSLAFGPAGPAGGPAGQQPPRFSAGSLISDGDLPEWLRQETAGPSVGSQAAWGGPAQPAQPAQSWQQPQQPQQQDIAALHTVRQPAIGAPNPAQAPYPQQPAFAPQSAPAPYPQPQPGYPQGPQSGFQQAYPQGYPPAPYPQQPAPANYGGYGRPPTPPPPPPSINAFPGIEQAGTAYTGPQVGGMAAQALLNQQALPNWLAGAQPGLGQAARGPAPSGMQARSLVDDQALPKWLRDQPDPANQVSPAERQNVSEWIGASAAQEPIPQFLNDAYAQAQIARAPQPGPSAFGAAPASALGQPAASFSPPFSPPYGAPAGGAASPARPGDDGAAPEWLRAQAGAAPAGGRDGAGGFAASDLIDPSALPAWVTGKAPVEQVFSSTHGWSAASPDSPSAFATSDQGMERGMERGMEQGMEQGANQGYAEQGFEQGFGQGFGRGYDQDFDQGYDQSQQGAAGYADFGGDESAQPAWSEAQWDADGSAYGDDDAPRGRRGQRRAQRDGRHAQAQPLAPDELPPWLRGKAGAPAASAHMPAAQRNPWASAAAPMEPMGSMEAWEEGEPWAAQQDAPAEQGWGAEASQRDAWGHAEPSTEWGEQPSGRRHHGRSAERRRDGWDDDPAYSSGAHAGYTDERYASRYDQSPDGYGEYDEDDDYADDPSDRKRGGGWLGFMRRDKR